MGVFIRWAGPVVEHAFPMELDEAWGLARAGCREEIDVRSIRGSGRLRGLHKKIMRELV